MSVHGTLMYLNLFFMNLYYRTRILIQQVNYLPSITINRPYSRCQSLKPSLVFLNRASYGRRRNNDVTSQEREVTMMLRHNLRTDAQICGKSATQASLFVRHGRGVNRVYSAQYAQPVIETFIHGSSMVYGGVTN